MTGDPNPRQSRALATYGVFFFVAIIVLLSAVAAGIMANYRRQEESHLSTARMAAAKMAVDFEHHLDQLAEDALIIAELSAQTGADPRYPASIRKRVLDDGVRALSSAVHHCRGVAFSAIDDGKGDIDVAIDPTEEPALASWLKATAQKLAPSSHGTARLLGPMPGPNGRAFFLQLQHQTFGWVVAAVDAPRLFETLHHGRPPDSRYLLIDGTDTLWVGCGSLATCQALPRAEWSRDEELARFMNNRASGPARDIPERLRGLLALPANPNLAVEWQPLATGEAPLALGLLTSRSELTAYRRAELWRLFALGAAMVLCAGIAVFFVWRQRQQEYALHERLAHAEELNRLEHQLVRAEKLATVGVMAAGLAHELGTPLAIIRGRAEILEEQTKLPEIRTILDQSDHIASTLRQVLDFSRQQAVNVRPTEVVAVMRTVVELLDFRLRAKSIRCRVEPTDEPLVVAADPDQLQQVLVNLVMNGCDACAPAGEIVLRATRPADAPALVCMEVADDGCGIPAANLDAVFDPFFTTKAKGEGTGLGLPVAAGIVRNHNGHISITSNEGRGTTVTVLWPADQGPPS